MDTKLLVVSGRDTKLLVVSDNRPKAILAVSDIGHLATGSN